MKRAWVGFVVFLGIIWGIMPIVVYANPLVKMTIEIQNQKKPVSGEIVIELFEKEAPITVANFLNYVDQKFYNGTVFHRVINGFMIQGGGFDPNLKNLPTEAPIQNEAHNQLKNEIGTLAMARTGQINSATAQFFINVNNNAFLNHQNKSARGYGYAVFGKVFKGIDIVNQIKTVQTHSVGPFQNVPVDPVVITKAERIKSL